MWNLNDIPDLSGKVAVVTGANGGLGLSSAKALAGKGAHVVMAARNQAKAQSAKDEILAAHPTASLEIVELDLGSLASVQRAADAINAAHDRLDILMLNAGLMAMPLGRTEDGFETQLGVNVLGHWALTSHLLPLVVRTDGARIVTLSSVAQHQGRTLDPSDPHAIEGYNPWQQYANTKLAMRHLAVGLQEQFEAAGVNAMAVAAHPGLTNSDLQTRTNHANGAGWQGPFWDKVTDVAGMSTDYGALSQLRAATDPGVTGKDYVGPLFAVAGPPTKKPLVRPGSDAAVAALWKVGEQETGLRVDVAEALAAA